MAKFDRSDAKGLFQEFTFILPEVSRLDILFVLLVFDFNFAFGRISPGSRYTTDFGLVFFSIFA